jgi:hypothetical protein
LVTHFFEISHCYLKNNFFVLDGVIWTPRQKMDTFSFCFVTVRGLKLEGKNQGDQDWSEVCRFYYSECSSLWRATTFYCFNQFCCNFGKRLTFSLLWIPEKKYVSIDAYTTFCLCLQLRDSSFCQRSLVKAMNSQFNLKSPQTLATVKNLIHF